jgi:DME family drug/metabolite transporter
MVLWTFGCKIHGSTQFSSMAIYFCKRLNNFFDFKSLSFFEEGKDFYKNYLKIGMSGVIGGTGLGIAMITFIYSITNTSAAVTLLCLAAMPFFTALLGFLFLKEKISLNVWIAIIIATVGIIIIAIGNTEKNSLLGLIFGMTSSIGFSVFFSDFEMEKRNTKIYNSCFCWSFLLCSCCNSYFI